MFNCCVNFFVKTNLWTCNLVLQDDHNGMDPLIIQVFVVGHKDPDSNRSEVLCDENATEKLVWILA
jgi:hypothetical protein